MEEKKKTNFEILAERGRELFRDYDRNAIAGKYGTKFDEDWLYLTFIREKYRIERTSGVVEIRCEKSGEWSPAGPGEALIFYDLFCYGKADAKASGTFINHNSLVQKISATANPGGGMYFKYEQRFSGHIDRLKKACEALGGTPIEKGDAAFELPLFDFLKCRFQFWEADEEFPASIVIFMDADLLNFMHFETTWYVSLHLLDRIAAEAGV